MDSSDLAPGTGRDTLTAEPAAAAGSFSCFSCYFVKEVVECSEKRGGGLRMDGLKKKGWR